MSINVHHQGLTPGWGCSDDDVGMSATFKETEGPKEWQISAQYTYRHGVRADCTAAWGSRLPSTEGLSREKNPHQLERDVCPVSVSLWSKNQLFFKRRETLLESGTGNTMHQRINYFLLLNFSQALQCTRQLPVLL